MSSFPGAFVIVSFSDFEGEDVEFKVTDRYNFIANDRKFKLVLTVDPEDTGVVYDDETLLVKYYMNSHTNPMGHTVMHGNTVNELISMITDAEDGRFLVSEVSVSSYDHYIGGMTESGHILVWQPWYFENGYSDADVEAMIEDYSTAMITAKTTLASRSALVTQTNNFPGVAGPLYAGSGETTRNLQTGEIGKRGSVGSAGAVATTDDDMGGDPGGTY